MTLDQAPVDRGPGVGAEQRIDVRVLRLRVRTVEGQVLPVADAREEAQDVRQTEDRETLALRIRRVLVRA